MGDAVGGSIESVSLGGVRFDVPGDTDTTRKLGGSENEIKINGSGTARIIKTKTGWSVADLSVSCDDTAGDHEDLQDLSDRKKPFTVKIVYASGVIYQGTGTITGELAYSNQDTVCSFGLGGGGKLTPQ